MAQLSCLAEYDKSFSNDFELLWEKDDMELSLNYTENSRQVFFFFSVGGLQTIKLWKGILPSVSLINIANTSLYQQVLCGRWCSSDYQRKPQRPGRVQMRGKNSGGQRHGPSAALGARWANVFAIFLHWVKGSENHGAALMYNTSIKGSICQETRPGHEHEHADCGFVSAPLCLTITRYFWHFKSKRNSDSPVQQCSSFHILWHSGWFDWTLVPLAFFCCRDWCVCGFPKPCCCDGFQMSLMHPSPWFCLNTRAKVWSWTGPLGTITTAQPQVKRGICVCRC